MFSLHRRCWAAIVCLHDIWPQPTALGKIHLISILFIADFGA
jgi:hypothetical protein